MADLNISALRKRIGSRAYPAQDVTIDELRALLDAAEQLQAVTAERDRLDAKLASLMQDNELLRRQQQRSLEDWNGIRAEMDRLRAQRDALLAALECGQVIRTHDLDPTKRWVIDDVDEVIAAIRAAKETNQ